MRKIIRPYEVLEQLGSGVMGVSTTLATLACSATPRSKKDADPDLPQLV